jgi:hypothetical protein
MESRSTLRIKWVRPDVRDEVGEYFENDHTKKFLKSKGISFKTEKELLDFLNSGELVSITKNELLTDFENMTLRDVDFLDELKDIEYRKSFESMEKNLIDTGTIALPAPIILKIGTTYYGFAGNRRTNLAFKHNLPLKVWLIKS